jgi:hypothetical protein
MRIILCLFLLLFLGSCQNGKNPPDKTVNRPDTVISEKQMVRILTEMHLTEAALILLRNRGTDINGVTAEYYNILFSRYKTSKKNFVRNLEYYQEDPEKFLAMYDEVIRKLDTLAKGKVKKIKSAEE